MRIHSLWESMASIFRTANQGKKEKYIFASKISPKNERTTLSLKFYQMKQNFSCVISIPHLIVAYIDKT